MQLKHHSWFTLRRNYYLKILPLLGSACRARGGLESIRNASSIMLIKRDHIGDFVLATTFFDVAYRYWQDRDVTLVCSPAGEGLARLLYPKWKIRVVVENDAARNYQGTRRNPSELQRELRAWPKVELMVSLRSLRHLNEIIFDSWIPASAKLAVQNQYHYEKGEYIKVKDSRVYSHVIDGGVGGAVEVCRDIENHRRLISTLFPNEAPELCWPALDFGDRSEAISASAAARGAIGADRLVLCPFPSAPIRGYPKEKLVPIISQIARKHGLEIVILGGEKDRVEAVALAGSFTAPKGAISLAGDLSISESVMAIRSARLAVGVDTGPMHVAIACEVPTVVLLGGGHYGAFGPWGDPTRTRWLTKPMPCFDCNWHCCQPEPYCLRDVAPDQIEAATDELLVKASDRKGFCP
jgi:ADP-heptose:LPS heptosyltransferase